MTNKSIAIIKASRQALLSLVENLTTEQCNTIPPGFNNNIAWQLGHLIVSQQILCYKLGNQPLVIETSWVDKYRNGSKPESFISAEEIAALRAALLDNILQLEVDLANKTFENFTPYTISTYKGLTLNNVDDAIAFIVSHEGLHYGCCLMMKKFL